MNPSYVEYSMKAEQISYEHKIELLNKSISYHDPSKSWNKFNGIISIKMTRPNRSTRNSEIVSHADTILDLALVDYKS